jgi:hypothetical protein
MRTRKRRTGRGASAHVPGSGRGFNPKASAESNVGVLLGREVLFRE